MGKQTLTITYNCAVPFELGKKLYRVAECDKKVFNANCKACDGNGIITVNEVTFGCPCCSTGKASIDVPLYETEEWTICGIYAHDNMISVELKKDCDGIALVDTIDFQIGGNCTVVGTTENHTQTQEWFDTKETADRVIANRMAESKNKVIQFNKDHGTKFLWNFENKEGRENNAENKSYDSSQES